MCETFDWKLDCWRDGVWMVNLLKIKNGGGVYTRNTYVKVFQLMFLINFLCFIVKIFICL